MGRSYQFLINTGGACFLCLDVPNSIDNSSTSNNITNNGRRNLFSLKMLARFVNFDFGKVFSPPSSSSFPNLVADLPLENAELEVPLCVKCSKIMGEFNELYETLERVRMGLEDCVRKVGGAMEVADERVVHEYQRRVAQSCTSSWELVAASVTAKLRKEMFEKCGIAGKKALPRVQLDKGNETTGIVDELALASIGITCRPDQLEDDEVIEEEEEQSPYYPKVHPHLSQPSVSVTFTRLPNRKNRCNLCFKTFSIRSSLTDHRIWHETQRSGTKQFSCEHCSQSFKLRASLWHHRHKYHAGTFFSQEFQDPVMISKLFDSLIVRKARQRHFQCPLCSKRFGTGDKYRLQGHLIVHHMKQLVDRLRALQPGIGNDDDDLIVITAASSKQIKLTKLANDEGYRCSLCSKVIVNSANAKLHILMHTGEKPFSCDLCPRSFRYPVNLQDHAVAAHRSAFFAAYKDPRLSSEQFETVVAELFGGISIPELPGAPGKQNNYKCAFCERNYGRDVKVRVYRHIVEKHMDRLTPRLRELQAQIAMGADPAPSPPKVSIAKPVTPTLTSFDCKEPRHSQNPVEQVEVTRCQYCNAPFSHQDQCRKHVLRFHKLQLFQPHQMPHVDDDSFLELLDQSMKSHTEIGYGGGIGCTICHGLFPSEELAEAHIVFSHKAQLGRTVEQAQHEEDPMNLLSLEYKPEPEVDSPPPGVDESNHCAEGGGSELTEDIKTFLGI